MKRLFIILILLSQVFLIGCGGLDIFEDGNFIKNIINREEKPKANNNSNQENKIQDEASIRNIKNEYLHSIEKVQDLDSTKIATVGQALALDLLTEDFERLESFYNFSPDIEEIILSEEARKEIVFHNLEIGEIEKIDEAYVYNYGTNRFVMVPVEASMQNMNFLISFNKNNQIVGFSYEEYQQRSGENSRIMPEGIEEEEFSFNSEGFLITGTLTRPAYNEGEEFMGTYPLIVLVHGFGPHDRNASIFENKPFRDLAWGLAEAGIASYRYDKKTYLYENVINDQAFTVYGETINDAVAASDMAKNLKNIDPNQVYILGASQGGYLLPRIAEGIPDAAGFIFMSSPAEHMKNYLKEQYEYLAMEDGAISLNEHTIINQVMAQINSLDQAQGIPEEEKVFGFHKNYWTDLNSYNPIETANKITAPVILLQGERDYQVTTKQYNLWMNAFFESENWTFKAYPNLNHFMMEGEGNSYSSEYRQKNYVDEQVIQDIATFIYSN